MATNMTKFNSNKRLPKFLDTQEKWDNVVRDTDTYQKFEDMALEIFDHQKMDIFEFRDILNDITIDIKRVHPMRGDIITEMVNTVNSIADAMMKTICDDETYANAYDNNEPKSDECDCLEYNDDYNEGVKGYKLQGTNTPPSYYSYSQWSDRPWKPANMKYLSFEDRLKSFGNWPQQMLPRPEELAAAGLFYEDVSDMTQCFHCGVRLYKWKRSDVAKLEHKKHRPLCPFIQYIM